MSLSDASPDPRRASARPTTRSGVERSLRRPDLDGLLTRLFGSEPAASPGDRAEGRAIDTAVEAIRRGAAHLADLQGRYTQLQDELASATQRHRLELEEARRDLGRWQEAARALGERLGQVQLDLAETKRLRNADADRAEAEHRRAAAVELRMQGLEHAVETSRDALAGVLEGAAPAGPRTV